MASLDDEKTNDGEHNPAAIGRRRSLSHRGVVIDQPREKGTHVARFIEMARDALCPAANRKRQTIEIGHDRKPRIVGVERASCVHRCAQWPAARVFRA